MSISNDEASVRINWAGVCINWAGVHEAGFDCTTITAAFVAFH